MKLIYILKPISTNMRVNQEEKKFSDGLLQVGEGHPQLESRYECEDYHEQMITIDKSLILQSYVDPLKGVADAA